MNLPIIQSPIDLNAVARTYRDWSQPITRRIVVCAGTGCVANGSLAVYQELTRRIREVLNAAEGAGQVPDEDGVFRELRRAFRDRLRGAAGEESVGC